MGVKGECAWEKRKGRIIEKGMKMRQGVGN